MLCLCLFFFLSPKGKDKRPFAQTGDLARNKSETQEEYLEFQALLDSQIEQADEL